MKSENVDINIVQNKNNIPKKLTLTDKSPKEQNYKGQNTLIGLFLPLM